MIKEERAERARNLFAEAKSRFHDMCPPIKKNRRVHFEHKDQKGSTDYTYSELSNTIKTIKHALKECGLTYDWKTRYEGTWIFVRCILTHVGGHSEWDEVRGTVDDSGKKNDIQQMKSSITYLRRAALESVCGLAAEGDDNDGRNSGFHPDSERDYSTTQESNYVDDETYKTLMNSVKLGKTTVAAIKEMYDLTPEEESSLLVFEKQRAEQTPPFN